MGCIGSQADRPTAVLSPRELARLLTWHVMAPLCPTASVGLLPLGPLLKSHTVFLSPPAQRSTGQCNLWAMALDAECMPPLSNPTPYPPCPTGAPVRACSPAEARRVPSGLKSTSVTLAS